MSTLKERITPDTLLEGVVLTIAVYLATKVFEPVLSVLFFIALGVGVYLAIRNRGALGEKLSEIKNYFKNII